MGLVEILDDGKGLGQHMAVDRQCRHQTLRVADEMVYALMLVLEKIDRYGFICEAKKIERNAHAVAGG